MRDDASLDVVERFDCVVWMGDFNYRVAGIRKVVDVLMAQNMMEVMKVCGGVCMLVCVCVCACVCVALSSSYSPSLPLIHRLLVLQLLLCLLLIWKNSRVG